MSGGGTPSKTTQTQELPAWAIPYAKDVLSKGSALTDINKNPYVQYGGQRVADFSPLQQQSFDTAANLGYNPVGQQYTGENVGQYMNPYLQNALAPQLREAASAGMMAQNMDAAKAVGQGAFGGTRGALQQSLTQKNVLQNMADINAKGYSDAFNQAAGMFNADQARRIQEAQFGSQYGMDVNKLQNTYGQQQQAQQQRAQDIAYQNFLDQQNYPYKQLSYMSDLIKNPAIGSTSQRQMYEGSPNMLNTVAGLGLGAASLMKAGGGVVGYADGGDVTSPENINAILEKLSDQELAQVPRMHPELADEVQQIQAQRAQVRLGATSQDQGIAAAPAPNLQGLSMAQGGIVAFSEGGTKGTPARPDSEILTDLAQQNAGAMDALQQQYAQAQQMLIGANNSGDQNAIAQASNLVANLQSKIAEASQNIQPEPNSPWQATPRRSEGINYRTRASAKEEPVAEDSRALPPPPTEKSEGIAYGSGRILPALAGFGDNAKRLRDKYLEQTDKFYTPVSDTALGRVGAALRKALDPTQNPRQVTRVVDPAAPTAAEATPKGIAAAAAAIDQSNLKGVPKAAPEGKAKAKEEKAAAPTGLGLGLGAKASSSISTKTSGGLGDTDLAYKPMSLEELSAQQEKAMGPERKANAEILKPEDAAIKRLSDSLENNKSKQPSELLLHAALGFLGSKSTRFDPAAGLGPYLMQTKEQQKLNQAAEEHLAEAQRQRARYAVALEKGSKTEVLGLQNIVREEQKAALDAKLKQLQLAAQIQHTNVMAAGQNRNQNIEFYTALGGGDLQKGYALANANKTAAMSQREKQLAESALKDVATEYRKNNPLLLSKPTEFNRGLVNAQIQKMRELGYDEIADRLGFAGGAGAGSLGPLISPEK